MIKQFEVKTKKGTIRGVLNRPNKKGKFPVIVMSHGFTGTKTESHFLYTKLAKKLLELDIASVRFDFLGSGNSDGDFKYMTLTKEVNDLEYILDYVINLDFIDSENLNLLGFSMGGVVSIIASSKVKEIKNLILLNPACNMFNILSRYINEESIYEFLENEVLDVDGFLVGKELVDDVFDINVFEYMKKYKNKSFIIQGTEDITVYPINALKLKEIGFDVDLKFIKGADHLFSTVDYQREVINEIINFSDKYINV